MRTFETGATRDSDDNKLDFEGFLSPWALTRYAEYMHEHRVQADGTMRSSDNWQSGIPIDVYMKSMWRHFITVWGNHRAGIDNEDDICALLFNAMGMLHEKVQKRILITNSLPYRQIEIVKNGTDNGSVV